MTEGQKTSIQILEYLEAGLPFNHDLSAPIRFAAFFQNWREIPVTAYVIPEFQRWGSSCIIAAILGTGTSNANYVNPTLFYNAFFASLHELQELSHYNGPEMVN